jgi:hypothetical protein
LGANKGVGLVALRLTALLYGCGSVTATPTPNQPSVGTSGDAPSSAASAPAPTPAETESNSPGDIPDNEVYVPLMAPGGRVSVKVPEGWARSTTGTVTQLTDKLNRIKIAPSTAGSAPTVASLTRGDVPKLKSSVSNFNLGNVTTERRAGSTVVLVRYQGDSPQDPVMGKVVRDAFEPYVYYHNGQRLDLTLSGPTNADNVDPWRIVSESVRWQ